MKLVSDCCHAVVIRDNVNMRYRCTKCGNTCLVVPEVPKWKKEMGGDND
jgi:hypothetical protein